MASRLPAVFLTAWASVAPAAELAGTAEAGGLPLANLVVAAQALDEAGRVKAAPPPAAMALDQKSREFIPHVLAVRSGTPVYFPNSDAIKHHVYSFSPAKRFEIKLYSGVPPEPVVFGQPGIVALGCNIHDWMLGYVYVSDADYLAVSDNDGRWSLDLPNGRYRLTFWHPDAAEQPADQVVTLPSAELRVSLELKMRFQTGKPPASLQNQGYGDGF
ncbi:methylamine utilization protein [Methylomonas sp. EFPC3]|uniref:methylamine utilization protein n=1 Tax=Methylomonas sp. EFPC3 TaxID=3021710 RepID=UPI002415AB9E|nr:methylamine utilization protein [Methylomonas sp. EFPC3]WFP50303.1 methylamine utilization protein [Methylomonas sp. EFPC3]